MTEIRIAPDRAAITDLASEWLRREIQRAVEARGHASIALAGGSTPQPIHARIAEMELPWNQLSFYFGDERCVAPEDPESNYGQAKASLFDRLEGTRPTVHRMEGEDPDPDSAARRYGETLPDSLDILILGIGDDGHTASLFPGAAALDETDRRVLPVVGPKPPPRRLTLTPPAIDAAQHILMIAAGAAKAHAVYQALEGGRSPHEIPARLARRGTWILDRSAASELSRDNLHGKPS